MCILLESKILIISLVLCVKAIYAIFDEYLKFLDLNLVPKGPPRGHLGRPLFHDFRRWKCSRYNEILIILIFGRFWRELDRQELRHVFWWFSSVFCVNPWGEYALKTQLILTIPFWRLSENSVFVMPKSEFWDLNFGTPRAQKFYKKQTHADYFDFVKRSMFRWCFRDVRNTRFWNIAY